MLEASGSHTNDSGPTRGTDAVHPTAIDQVVAELAVSGMRMDRFMALATEGLLPDEKLRDLWRRHRDVLLPGWDA